MPTSHTPRERLGELFARSRVSPFLAFAIVACLGFASAVDNGFWLDDFEWIANAARASNDLSFVLSSIAGFFRPMVNLLFLGEYQAFGLNPAGYYLVNITLHITNASLLYLLVLRMTNGRSLALISGLLFAAAVGNYGESVLWISGATELLATFLYLSCLIFFQRWLATGRVRWYAAVLALYPLALLSKESAVTLIGALFLMQVLFRRQAAESINAGALLSFVPLLAMLLPYLIWEMSLQQSNYVVAQQHYQISPQAIWTLLDYFALTVIPIKLDSSVVSVPAPLLPVISLVRALASVGVLAAILVALAKGNRPTRFFVLWASLALIPYIFFTWNTTARYLYLPSAGFVTVLAVGLGQIHIRVRSHVKSIGVCVVPCLVVAILALSLGVITTVERRWDYWQSSQGSAEFQSLIDLQRSGGR